MQTSFFMLSNNNNHKEEATTDLVSLLSRSIQIFNDEQSNEKNLINELYFKFQSKENSSSTNNTMHPFPRVNPNEIISAYHHHDNSLFGHGASVSMPHESSSSFVYPHRLSQQQQNPQQENINIVKSYENLSNLNSISKPITQMKAFLSQSKLFEAKSNEHSNNAASQQNSLMIKKPHLTQTYSYDLTALKSSLPPSTSQVSNSNIDMINSQKNNSSSSSSFKVGYLLKRSHHARMKNWLKRLCKSDNGYFYIYHNDVS
jgi:hypothetical protein